MALSQDHMYHGATMTSAYHKITHLSGNCDKLHVDVAIYENQAAADTGNPADNYSFVMKEEDLCHDGTAPDVNYTKQAYEFMKLAAFNDVRGVSRDYTSAADV